MTIKAVFEGLVFDEQDQQLSVSFVGEEPCYVMDDAGFLRHIPSEQVDRQVLGTIAGQVEENKDAITEQTVKMLGQDDLFTHAVIQKQLENMEEQVERILQHGLPEDGRAYLGIMGFKIVINCHGDVLRVAQPTLPGNDEE